MLSLLKIRDLALVDELVWKPENGFLSITGETGAGKSVIMGSISLVLGERADKSCIRTGKQSCSLEAVFTLPHPELLNARLEEAGVPPCEQGELILRRIITSTGNRQFINNSPVTLNILRKIGDGLADMQHPDSPRSLTLPDQQLAMLDAFADASAEYSAYRQAYRDFLQAERDCKTLAESEAADERELDFLRHQVREIEEADFSAEEVSHLEERWKRVRNSERLRETASPLPTLLDGGEGAVLDILRRAVRRARELERMDAACSSWLHPLAEAVETIDHVCAHAQDYIASLECDPEQLAQLEERVSLWDTLRRKYGADYTAVCARHDACCAELAAIENRDANLAELEEKKREKHEAVLRAAAELSVKRKKAAPQLEKLFLENAAHLGFRRAVFRVQITPLATPGPHGAEAVLFLFGPNPGEPPEPLRRIASGGELARVMLALRSILAKQDDTPLLVFDEIDANVGGEVARAVGQKMLELGKNHQVITITHFPQVAALAAHHYLIAKQVCNGRSISRLQEVTGRARIAELMRMLGSSGPEAEAHARNLLSRPSDT